MKTIDIFKINIEIDKLYHKLEEEDKKIFSNIMDAFDNCVVENDKKDKEIERLNNIINELEKYLIKVIETSTEQEKITCSFVLKYLQELKGDGSNEKDTNE